MVSSYFMAACYLLPLLGGFVADNFFGKYRTIVYFSVPYIIGQVILGISALHNETCLYLSLGLLAMGSGVIKPNISTLMGLTYDQRRPGKSKLRSDAFAMFYGVDQHRRRSSPACAYRQFVIISAEAAAPTRSRSCFLPR